VSANVEPEEARALREALEESVAPGTGVVGRDFSRPVRLSASDREALGRALENALAEAEAAISAAVGTRCGVTLDAVSEASAADLFGEDEDGAYAAIRFTVQGQPGWIVWETIAAVRTVERVLGSMGEVKQARRFSAIECTVLESLLAGVADVVLRAVNVEADDVRVAQSREALGSWLDAGDGADPHRLHFELRLESPGGPSRIDCYLPIGLAKAVAVGQEPVALPDHLDAVDVEVSVRFEGCEVRLAQLLQLEEGDVIPLDGKVGDLAHFCVEGKRYAQGVLGTREGHLAIRIEQLESEPEESR